MSFLIMSSFSYELLLNITLLFVFSLSLSMPLALLPSVLLPVHFSLTHRSSNIRPGQFGYGKVPFSLPLHRPNRQARHTDNSTDAVTPATGQAYNKVGTEANRKETEEAGADVEDKEAVRNEETESTDAPAADQSPAAATTSAPRRHVDRPSQTNRDHGRNSHRATSSRTLLRSSSPSVLSHRPRFDWHSVTAPPPPVPPLPRPNSPAAASPFSASLHRSTSLHTDGEFHTGFSPQLPSASNVYPLQHIHIPHLGADSSRDGGRGPPQVYRCSGPEKEYRRCFSQVNIGFHFIYLTFFGNVLKHFTFTLRICTPPAVMPDLYACHGRKGAVGRLQLRESMVSRVYLIGRSFPSFNTSWLSTSTRMETDCVCLCYSQGVCVFWVTTSTHTSGTPHTCRDACVCFEYHLQRTLTCTYFTCPGRIVGKCQRASLPCPVWVGSLQPAPPPVQCSVRRSGSKLCVRSAKKKKKRRGQLKTKTVGSSQTSQLDVNTQVRACGRPRSSSDFTQKGMLHFIFAPLNVRLRANKRLFTTTL